MAVLPTNYLDDILAASMGGKRRFRITHEDGSTEEVTLEDVSEYEQVGSPFGSGDVNKTNQAVNEKLDSADVVDPALATVLGFAADAKLTGDALSELNKNFTLNGTYIFHPMFSKEIHSSDYRAYIPLLGADKYNVTAIEVSIGDKFDNTITSSSRIVTTSTEISIYTNSSNASGQCAYVKLSIVPK